MTTERSTSPAESGGDPPCWGHLFSAGAPASPHPLGTTGWHELVDQLADAVLVADRDGVITYWNSAAARLFGWSAAEAVGGSLDLIIPERQRDRHWEGYNRTVDTGITRYGTQLLEVPARHRDGRALSIAFTLTVLSDPIDGRVTRLVAVVRDDTVRWKERRELAQLRAETGPPAARQ